MAYVKLPEELRSWEVLLPSGGASRFEFSIFAGETIKVENRGGRAGGGGSSIHVRSQRGERRFDFSQLPVAFKTGDVVGVLAVLPENEADGPILCVANLDSDQRVDFLTREPELLRLMAQSEDLRTAALGWGEMIGDLFRAAVFGVVAAVGAAAATAGFSGSEGGTLIGRVVDAFGGGAPWLVGAVASVVGFGVLLTTGTLRISRRARFQRELLDHLWTRAGDALGFVQDNIDAFRFSSIVMGQGGAGGEKTQLQAGEPVEREKPVKPLRAEAEDAKVLPQGLNAAERGAPQRGSAMRRRIAAEAPRSKTASEMQAGSNTANAFRREPPRIPRDWKVAKPSETAAARTAPPADAQVERAEPRPIATHRMRPLDAAPRHKAADQSRAAAQDGFDAFDMTHETASARLGRLAEGLRGAPSPARETSTTRIGRRSAQNDFGTDAPRR